MPIQITCPSCSRQLRVPDNLVGQYVKCPGCEKTFTASVEEGGPAKESLREDAPASRQSDEQSYKPADAPPPARTRPRPPRDDDDFDDDRPSRRGRRDFAPHRGTLILVLGILSLVGAGMFTGIPAWILGNHDMKEIREGRMDPEGESNTNIGRILGMVSTIISVVTLLGVGGCCCFGGFMGAMGK